MLDRIRQLTGDAAPDPVRGPDPEPAPAWDFDPAAPADTHDPEPSQLRADLVLEKLDTLIDRMTPGTPGWPGDKPIPELRHDAGTVAAGGRYTIPANRYRASLSIHNTGPDTVYVVPVGALDTTRGMPIPANAEREIRVPQRIDLQVASGSAVVRILEESS